MIVSYKTNQVVIKPDLSGPNFQNNLKVREFLNF